MLDTIRAVAGLILLLSTTVSLLASGLVMYLIIRLKTLNSYHRIIFTLCCLQAIYNIAYYFLPGYRTASVLGIYRFLTTFAGIAVCMWTNFISFVNLYTIAYLQPFPLLSWHRNALYTTLGISGIFAMVFLLVSLVKDADHTMNYLYFYFRVVSTLFNIVMFCVLYFIFNRPGCASCIDRWFSQYDFTMRDMTQDLLAVLSSKLMFYPIVQIVSRVVSLWWEYKYGFTVSAFDEGDYTIRKAGAMFLYALFSPSAGLGYIGVMLYVHPGARQEVFQMLRCQRTAVVGSETSPMEASNESKLADRDTGVSEDTRSVGSSLNKASVVAVPPSSFAGHVSSLTRESVSSTVAERDSMAVVQSQLVVRKGAVSTTTTNPIQPSVNDNGNDISPSHSKDETHFPLRPQATGRLQFLLNLTLVLTFFFLIFLLILMYI